MSTNYEGHTQGGSITLHNQAAFPSVSAITILIGYTTAILCHVNARPTIQPLGVQCKIHSLTSPKEQWRLHLRTRKDVDDDGHTTQPTGSPWESSVDMVSSGHRGPDPHPLFLHAWLTSPAFLSSSKTPALHLSSFCPVLSGYRPRLHSQNPHGGSRSSQGSVPLEGHLASLLWIPGAGNSTSPPVVCEMFIPNTTPDSPQEGKVKVLPPRSICNHLLPEILLGIIEVINIFQCPCLIFDPPSH